ncbi:MAG: hypothetical protein ACYCPQ_03680 [Elusimicrobiota bacterium]
MQMLNRYFSPFALFLILSAVYFSDPDPFSYRMSLGILAAAVALNWWLTANTYRFIRWARRMRRIQIWANLAWTIPLFYLLQPFWAPMWLLFVMAPVTAALYVGFIETLLTSVVAAGIMIGIYFSRGVFSMGAAEAGMALTQALFILIVALFINGLAAASLRLRDANLG